jgi:hypothetical protein
MMSLAGVVYMDSFREPELKEAKVFGPGRLGEYQAHPHDQQEN